MRAKILFAVGLVTVAMSLVLAAMVGQMQRVAASIQKESQENIPLYRATGKPANGRWEAMETCRS
jgi:hypothetical protein